MSQLGPIFYFVPMFIFFVVIFFIISLAWWYPSYKLLRSLKSWTKIRYSGKKRITVKYWIW